jgi:hypothetical protein
MSSTDSSKASKIPRRGSEPAEISSWSTVPFLLLWLSPRSESIPLAFHSFGPRIICLEEFGPQVVIRSSPPNEAASRASFEIALIGAYPAVFLHGAGAFYQGVGQ